MILLGLFFRLCGDLLCSLLFQFLLGIVLEISESLLVFFRPIHFSVSCLALAILLPPPNARFQLLETVLHLLRLVDLFRFLGIPATLSLVRQNDRHGVPINNADQIAFLNLAREP